MNAPIQIARTTTSQVLGLRRLIGLGILTMVPGVTVFLSTARTSPTSRLDVFMGITVGFFFSVVVPVVALVLAASALGDERRDQTLSFIVLRPISRISLAAAKIIGATAASWVVVALGGLALGIAMGVRHGDWGYLIPLILGACIAATVYAAIFVPLGYLSERATLAGLAFAFIWEGAVVGAIGALASLSPWRIGFSAFAALVPSEALAFVPDFALGNVVPGAGGAAAKAVVALAVGVWLTAWILRSRDLV